MICSGIGIGGGGTYLFWGGDLGDLALDGADGGRGGVGFGRERARSGGIRGALHSDHDCRPVQRLG